MTSPARPGIMALFLALLLLLPVLVAALPRFGDATDNGELAVAIVNAMTDEEVLAQLLLPGYEGEQPGALILDWIRGRGLGGVKIFGWNAENTLTLASAVAQMQRASQQNRFGLPLFIATDQEGGWVRHIKGNTSVTPGNMAAGASGRPVDAFNQAHHIGLELRTLGVNMNFAPTVDVYVNPEAHVIGPRAFGQDAALAGILGVASFRGYQKAGVIAVAKHFPGHGNATGDSHGVLPRINDSFDTLWKRDLLPFRMLVAEGVPALLTGHLAFPRAAGSSHPATVIPFFATEIARSRMHFDGLLITDDMYMGGATASGLGLEEACIQSIESGHDLVMLSRTPGLYDRLWNSLVQRFRASATFRARARESAMRVILTKLSYLKNADRVPLEPEPAQVARLPLQEGQDDLFQLACRSVTTAVNSQGILPYRPAQGERILVAGPFRSYLNAVKARYPQASEYQFSFAPFYTAEPAEKASFASLAARADTIIFCLANPNGLEILQTLRGSGKKVIVMSALTPVYLRSLNWVHAAIAVFGWTSDSFIAGAAALAGDFVPEGRMPISLETETRSGQD